MDDVDDCYELRKNKPQQRLYRPGSGPLRRSSNALDETMDGYGVNNNRRGREHAHHGAYNSVSDSNAAGVHREPSAINSRQRKPEQQLYVPRSGDAVPDLDKPSRMPTLGDNSSQYKRKNMSNKQDKQGFGGAGSYSKGGSRRDFHYKDGSNNDNNYNSQYRQTSGSRSISPSHNMQEQIVNDRNRDSRSMETSGRSIGGGVGKPPSGRRNSAGYPSEFGRPKYQNLDNVPPRFRKKWLEQHGVHHSFEAVDQINRDRPPSYSTLPPYNQSQPFAGSGWSQTLPSRGRGRLRENENFDREKFINNYIKTYEVHNSRRSTPSNSCLNLYEPNAIEHHQSLQVPYHSVESQREYQKDDSTKNGISNVSSDHEASQNHDSDDANESISQISSQIIDMTLDWTEEVEKNIKLDDACDSTTSFVQNPNSSSTQDVKVSEPKESKKNTRSKRRDRRSSSRGKKSDKPRKDNNISVQNEHENQNQRIRRDSNLSGHHETVTSSLSKRERERRDSHRSNRSSNLGNSRDDLDRWRSVKSYSREQSTERKIVSQCNSRDSSANRAMSSRDNEGFRIPSAAPKSGVWNNSQSSIQKPKNNGTWASGRTPSVERGHSPTPSATGGEGAEMSSGRRGRKRTSRRRGGAKNTDVVVPPPVLLPTTPAPTNTNWRDEILESKKHTHDNRQSQQERSQRTRLNSNMSDKSESSNAGAHPGILILPQPASAHLQKDQGRGGSVENQKLLYDPQNPSKPIVVQTNSTKADSRMEKNVNESSSRGGGGGSGYEAGDAARAHKHRVVLQEVDRADAILRAHTLRGPLALAAYWDDVVDTRKFLQNSLLRLLMTDLKYCQADNVEHNFWKILYYNFIEMLRKSFPQIPPEDKPKIVKLINIIIEEGNEYFENLVQLLEKTYKFNTDDYINDNHLQPPKGLGYVGLALISVQKLYVFLGDLARYKEQVNETNNFSKSKFWYTKAQQINPKNGRPYNQLAILAIYARRKLDAVYYYMRSLMSSNPFHSARESLLSLFDENSKKYEAAERKRRAAIASAVTVENGEVSTSTSNQGSRREVWVRPSGHRTTTLGPHTRHERLASMTHVELNKTFITSYLHVHGKLITKIGMETFHESAAQMLRQFTALLHRQPLPTPSARLLQLTALNMFAVETNAAASLKEGGARSAWLECALCVALLMFGALLERCCALLPEPATSQHHADALLLLPAIKVWSDWMLCHSSVWNPPPSFDNFDVDGDNDPWDWLAKLMNILEELDDKSLVFQSEPKDGLDAVRLPEDSSLAGFTPLMYMEPAAACCDASAPPHAAEHALRARKLLFFGTEYLVGVEPPVLKLEYPTDAPPRYVSAVTQATTQHVTRKQLSSESGEEMPCGASSEPTSLSSLDAASDADAATRRLLRRKEQLETRNATLDKRRQHVQDILRSGSVSVEVEVRPRWLVPDTNCFIDHLTLLQGVAATPEQPYLLAVPLVVMAELEGLCRCTRLGERARAALSWVSGVGAGGVRLATARGSLLASRAFTAETVAAGTNDDRVLATALNLHANLASEPDTPRDDSSGNVSDARFVKRVREVVLLTDDRNLRVKALAAELPARDLPSFIHWAGLDATLGAFHCSGLSTTELNWSVAVAAATESTQCHDKHQACDVTTDSKLSLQIRKAVR